MKKSLLFSIVALLSMVAWGRNVLPISSAPITVAEKSLVAAPFKAAAHLGQVAKAPALADVVTPPQAMTTETYTLQGSGFYYDGGWTAMSATWSLLVGFDGNDVYIRGLGYYMNEAWVQGTLADGKVTFASGQFLGNDGNDAFYLVATESVSPWGDLDSFAFDYDAETGTFTLEAGVDINEAPAANSEGGIYDYWTGTVKLVKGEVEADEVVTLPDGVTPEEYVFSAKSLSWDDNGNEQRDDVSRSMMVAIDGNDVYLQGLSTNVAEAWVKGELNAGGNVVFPAGQYLGQKDYSMFGIYDFYFNGYDNATGEIKDLPMAYDADADRFTTAANDWVRITTSKYGIQSYAIYVDVVIEKVHEQAGTPATPSIIAYDDDGGMIWVELDIPLVDTEGNGLSTDKLSYKFYTDINQDITPFVFVGGDYVSIGEDTEEIPYNLDDNTEFLRGGEVVIMYAYDSEEWNRLGVQTIYRGGGEEHASEIGWFEIKAYATAITDVKATTDADNAIYDMQGRRVSGTLASGIYVSAGKKVLVK